MERSQNANDVYVKIMDPSIFLKYIPNFLLRNFMRKTKTEHNTQTL